jgi:hypothetical protein
MGMILPVAAKILEIASRLEYGSRSRRCAEEPERNQCYRDLSTASALAVEIEAGVPSAAIGS